MATTRKLRGWTQDVAAREFMRIADRRNVATGEFTSIRTAISRWENGKQIPDEVNRALLRELYGLTDGELGFALAPSPGDDAERQELSARLRSGSRLDDETIRRLDLHTDHIRLTDRTFGAAVVLDEMSSHLQMVAKLRSFSLQPRQRAELAAIVADASALAGWQALDSGAVSRSWEHFEVARAAAAESGHPELLAHALGEQSYALLELGQPTSARELVQFAQTLHALPDMIRAWLEAAEGEFLAAEGQELRSQRAFDRAQKRLANLDKSAAFSFLALDEVHLARWRGSALARLHLPTAIDELMGALARLDASFVRATAGIHVDLALIFSSTGHRDEARFHVRAAQDLARELGSQRLLRRLDHLRLPRASGENTQEPN